MTSSIFDNSISISLQDLRRLKLLNPSKCGYKEATVKINRRSGIQEIEGVVNIVVCLSDENCHMELKFIINGKEIYQRFELIKSSTIPPSGFKWMFICPLTGTKCLKLYLNNSSFKSRIAIQKGLYQIQTIRFGRKRSFLNAIRKESKLKKLVSKTEQPYFKPCYNGRITKTNMRIIEAGHNLKLIANQIDL